MILTPEVVPSQCPLIVVPVRLRASSLTKVPKMRMSLRGVIPLPPAQKIRPTLSAFNRVCVEKFNCVIHRGDNQAVRRDKFFSPPSIHTP